MTWQLLALDQVVYRLDEGRFGDISGAVIYVAGIASNDFTETCNVNSLELCFQNGESALHAASLFGHLKVVKELVKAGAKVDLKNKVWSCAICTSLLCRILAEQDVRC